MSAVMKPRQSILLVTAPIPPSADAHPDTVDNQTSASGTETADEENSAVLFHVICGGQMGDEFLVHANCSVGVMLNFIKLRLKSDFHMPDNAVVELFDETGKPLELSKVDPFLRGYNFVNHRGVYFPMFYVPPSDEEETEDETVTGASEPGGERLSSENEKAHHIMFTDDNENHIGSTDIFPEDHLAPKRSTSQPSESRRRKTKKLDKANRSRKSSQKSSKSDGAESVYQENEEEIDHHTHGKGRKSGERSREQSRPESALAAELQSRPQTVNKHTTTPVDDEFTPDHPDHVNGEDLLPAAPHEDEVLDTSNDNPEIPELEAAVLEDSIADSFVGEGDGLPDAVPEESKRKTLKSQTNIGDESGRKSRKARSEASKSKRRGVSGSARSKSGHAVSKKLMEVELTSSHSLARVEASKTEFHSIKVPESDTSQLAPEEAPYKIYTMKYFPDRKPVDFVPVVSKSFKSCVKLCKWVARLHNEIDKGVKDMDHMINDMVASLQQDEEEEEDARAAAAAAASSTQETSPNSAATKNGKKSKSKKSKNKKGDEKEVHNEVIAPAPEHH